MSTLLIWVLWILISKGGNLFWSSSCSCNGGWKKTRECRKAYSGICFNLSLQLFAHLAYSWVEPLFPMTYKSCIIKEKAVQLLVEVQILVYSSTKPFSYSHYLFIYLWAVLNLLVTWEGLIDGKDFLV